MRLQMDDEWEGWDGDTLVKLTDGSVWRQAEYYFEYQYAFRPHLTLRGQAMHVDGMSKAVKVRRID